MKSGHEILFQNFVSRDTCFRMIRNQIRILNDDSLKKDSVKEHISPLIASGLALKQEPDVSLTSFLGCFDDNSSRSVDIQKSQRIEQMKAIIP